MRLREARKDKFEKCMGTVVHGCNLFRTTCGLCCKHPALFEYQDLYILLLLVYLIANQLMMMPGVGRRRRSTLLPGDERFSMSAWPPSRSQQPAAVS